MTDLLLMAVAVLLLANLLLLILLLRKKTAVDLMPLQTGIGALAGGWERTERALRDDVTRGREESARQARHLREEVGATTQATGESLLRSLGEMTGAQAERFDALLAGLGRMADSENAHAQELRTEVGSSVKALNDSLVRSVGELAAAQMGQMEGFSHQLGRLTTSNETRLDGLRVSMEEKLRHMREDNARQLEQMRQTVDEKLQGTLERRLGESFQLVSERLELVHQGLGEMQTLASGVGDLKRVLGNVKVRGIWGEVQLARLLEQVLTPDQFAANVATREHSAERVDFAVRLPGRSDADAEPVWLPIDSKFPVEDYQRLIEASERGDPVGVEAAGRQLEQRIRQCAREICDKYLNPPRTTDFAILFLPTEGLYAEVIRRAGLVEVVQRECRVLIAGPTTLGALLNSLQMGFRTLAIQQRSSEVWAVLGAVKTEFGKFGSVIERVRRKLQEASNAVDQAATRSRAMQRKLRSVEEVVPAANAERALSSTPVEDAAMPMFDAQIVADVKG